MKQLVLMAVLAILLQDVVMANEDGPAKKKQGEEHAKISIRSESADSAYFLGSAEKSYKDFKLEIKRLQEEKIALPQYLSPDEVIAKGSTERVRSVQDKVFRVFASIETAKSYALSTKDKKRINLILSSLRENATEWKIYQAVSAFYAPHLDLLCKDNRTKTRLFLQGKSDSLQGVDFLRNLTSAGIVKNSVPPSAVAHKLRAFPDTPCRNPRFQHLVVL